MSQRPHAKLNMAAAPAQTPVPALRMVDEFPGTDLEAVELAAGHFLQALGVSIDSESLRDTPRRMTRAYAELFSPRPFNLTTFPNDEFVGAAHIGYVPGQRILGLSKLARALEHFACRPQVQEHLTKQVADWLQGQLEPKVVGVVIQAEHTCMTLRGVRATGAATMTSTLLGLLRTDARSRGEFLALTGLPR
jgi:GTP cyclohydrolase I